MSLTSTSKLKGESSRLGRATPSPATGAAGTVISNDESAKRKRTQSSANAGRVFEESQAVEVPEKRSNHGSKSIPYWEQNIYPNSDSSGNLGLQKINQTVEDRLVAIERILLNIQQALFPKLATGQESPPPPLPITSEIYEHARNEARVADFHKWNSFYIHGLVRITGRRSQSIIKDPPCESCVMRNRVCTVLIEDDPYRELLFVERKVCCGWCEHVTIGTERSKPVQGTHMADQEYNGSHSDSMDPQGKKRQKRRSYEPERKPVYFVSGEGIEREVITSEISRYLGNDALVRPGEYWHRGRSEPIQGYWVTAYRALTTEMLVDLKKESSVWRARMSSHSNDIQAQDSLLEQDLLSETEATKHPYFGYNYYNYDNPVTAAYELNGPSANNYAQQQMAFQHQQVAYETGGSCSTVNAGVRHSLRGTVSTGMYISRPDKSPTPCEDPPPFLEG